MSKKTSLSQKQESNSELAPSSGPIDDSASQRAQKEPLPASSASGSNKRKSAASGQQASPRRRRGNPNLSSSEQSLAPLAQKRAKQQGPAASQSIQEETGAHQASAGKLNGNGNGKASEENICAACMKPIKDRYLLVALDKQWHEDCLKCAGCGCRLGEVGSSLFTHSGKILCRLDFQRIFGQHGHCGVCKKSIPPYEMVMRANENAYHMDCFACQECQYRFCVGDRFHLTEKHKIICILCHSVSSNGGGGGGGSSSALLGGSTASPSANQNQNQNQSNNSNTNGQLLAEAPPEAEDSSSQQQNGLTPPSQQQSPPLDSALSLSATSNGSANGKQQQQQRQILQSEMVASQQQTTTCST